MPPRALAGCDFEDAFKFCCCGSLFYILSENGLKGRVCDFLGPLPALIIKLFCWGAVPGLVTGLLDAAVSYPVSGPLVLKTYYFFAGLSFEPKRLLSFLFSRSELTNTSSTLEVCID